MMQTYEAQKNALLKTYQALREKGDILPPDLIDRLDCPYLVHPHEVWPSATQRVLIVGQEPFNWGFDEDNTDGWSEFAPLWTFKEFRDFDRSPEALMHAYYQHAYQKTSKYRPSPYTKAIKYFSDPCDTEGSTAVITTNLFRCALTAKGPANTRSSINYAGQENLNRIYEWQQSILASEIKILKPNVVIFFSGPNYDSAISKEFPNVSFDPIGAHSAREMAMLTHPLLPIHSFRTYHPGYLARGKWAWLSELRTLMSEAGR